MQRSLILSSLLAVGLFSAGNFFVEAKADALWVSSQRINVVDGDTIRIGDDRYRLMGFDTPETRFAQCDSERERGNQATRRLETLIRSEADVILHVAPDKDRYDRFLATLEIAGQDVGPVLISEGLARPYDGGQRMGWC